MQKTIINFLGLKIAIEKDYEPISESYIDKKIERLFKEYNRNYYRNITSLTNSFALESHKDTLNWIKENIDISSVLLLGDRWKNLLFCASKAKENKGLFIECGVHTGRSINHVAKHFKDIKIYGFDSFEGLPEEWTGFTMQSGDFDLNGELPKVCANVELHKGWFQDILPQFLLSKNEKISFLHVDCDIYQSTVDVLDAVKNYLQEGTIIVFDEFFNYPNWRHHEFKAFNEFIEKTGIKFKYISIGHLQVGIEIVKLGEN